jgi:dihydropteroate synthase
MPDQTKTQIFRCRDQKLVLGKKTYIMGILNITPDSFTDGGRYLAPDAALDQARHLLASGADIIDIGGESTRPGSLPVSSAEELQRVMPVIEIIKDELDCLLSIDTSKPEVARAAFSAGVQILNDVNGLQGDSDLADLAASAGAGVVIMHNARLYQKSQASDIIGSMQEFFAKSLSVARRAGLEPHQLALDPGLGFGVDTDESLALLGRLPELARFGLPLLVGPSGKRFIGDVLQLPVNERLPGTAAAVVVAVAKGADLVRVHDVAAVLPYVKMADAICRGRRRE